MRNRNSNSTILNIESGLRWWKKRYDEEINRVVKEMKIAESKERNKIGVSKNKKPLNQLKEEGK